MDNNASQTSIPEETVIVPNPSPNSSGDQTSKPKITGGFPKGNRKRIVATIFGILVLIGAVGAGVALTRNQQLINQKAASGLQCYFSGGPIGQCGLPANTCSSGATFDSVSGKCYFCSSGTLDLATHTCLSSINPPTSPQVTDPCGSGLNWDTVYHACILSGSSCHVSGDCNGGGNPPPAPSGNTAGCGQGCTADSQCNSGLVCDSNAHVCWNQAQCGTPATPAPTPPPGSRRCGDSCTTNAQCASTSGVVPQCINGTCQNPSCPAGQTIPGSNCTCGAANRQCGQICGGNLGLCATGSCTYVNQTSPGACPFTASGVTTYCAGTQNGFTRPSCTSGDSSGGHYLVGPGNQTTALTPLQIQNSCAPNCTVGGATGRKATCGQNCSQDTDCMSPSGGGTSKCQAGLCVNTACPNTTVAGAACLCNTSTAQKQLCGQLCNITVGLCQAGQGSCRYINQSPAGSCPFASNTSGTFCVGTQNGFTTARCTSGDTGNSYAIGPNNQATGLTPQQLITSCKVCGDGVVQPGEDCDAGVLNGTTLSTCDSSCHTTNCGAGGPKCNSSCLQNSDCASGNTCVGVTNPVVAPDPASLACGTTTNLVGTYNEISVLAGVNYYNIIHITSNTATTFAGTVTATGTDHTGNVSSPITTATYNATSKAVTIKFTFSGVTTTLTGTINNTTHVWSGTWSSTNGHSGETWTMSPFSCDAAATPLPTPGPIVPGVCRNPSCAGNASCTCGTPIPTPAPQCTNAKAYDINWNQLTNAQLVQLKPGDKVNFTVTGTSSGTIDKARFTINGTLQPESSLLKPGSTTEFYFQYTIPTAVTSFNVSAQLHDSTSNSWF